MKNTSMPVLKIASAAGSYPPLATHVDWKLPRHMCMAITMSDGQSLMDSQIISAYLPIQPVRVKPLRLLQGADLRVTEVGEEDIVHLQIAAAAIVERPHRLA